MRKSSPVSAPPQVSMKTSPRRTRAVFAAVFIAIAVSGCMEFEQQTLWYHHDAATDTLRIHQTYRGIHGSDLPEGLSALEIDQLRSVWNGERTFFFGNWITELDLTSGRKTLAETPASDLTEPARAYDAAMRRVISLLLAHSHISNGPFYTDDSGRLCGVQRVEITNLSRIIPAANDAMRAAFAEEAANENNDEGKRTRYARAANDPAPFIVITGNRISVRIPASREEFESEASPEDDDNELQALQRAGGSATFADDIVTITFGREDSERESLTLPEQPKVTVHNAETFVRERFGIAAKFDPAADADQFLRPQ